MGSFGFYLWPAGPSRLALCTAWPQAPGPWLGRPAPLYPLLYLFCGWGWLGPCCFRWHVSYHNPFLTIDEDPSQCCSAARRRARRWEPTVWDETNQFSTPRSTLHSLEQLFNHSLLICKIKAITHSLEEILFLPQIFIEGLLCARHWGPINE